MVHWSCWMTLCILGPAWLRRPENGFRIASSWLSWAQMGPTWSQVDSKLAQVGVMLGPNWLQVGSSWAMLAPSWLPLRKPQCEDMPHPSSWPQVGSMLAPCWLHVGSMLAPCWLMLAPCWFMLDQMPSKIAEDAILLAQVGLKMTNMVSNSNFWSIFDQTLVILTHPGPQKYQNKHWF